MTPDEMAWCDSVVVAGSHPVKYSTWELVLDLLHRKVPGELAECGVMAGGHIAVMVRAMASRGESRLVHAFDSFEGIPQAGERDLELCRKTYGAKEPGQPIKSSGISKVDVAGFNYFMRMWGVSETAVAIHKGWFEETLERDAKSIQSLALLRIDVDLYDSVVPCLQHLYPKVSKGGIVIFDDYGQEGELIPCRDALEKYLGEIGEKPEIHRVTGNETTAWWIKA